MEQLLHDLQGQGWFELLLIVFGYFMGVAPRLQRAFMLFMFILRIVDWWIKNHPHGQKMAEETDLDTKFYNLFGVELEKHSHLFNHEAKVDKQ